jgi:hypothetical protein
VWLRVAEVGELLKTAMNFRVLKKEGNSLAN